MKKLITLLLLVGMVALFMVACGDDDTADVTETPELLDVCMPADLQNGLIAYFPFSGGLYNDVVQNIALSFSTEVPAADRNGNASCAVAFDAANDSFLACTDPTFLNNLSQMTVSLWYQPQGDQVGNVSGYELLIGRDEGFHCPDTEGQWSLGLYDLRRAVFGHGNSVWEDAMDPSASTEWKHVTATWNQLDNTTKIYINGVLSETGSGLGGCENPPVATDNGVLFIGRYFTGKIDDIAIYKSELSAAEVAQLHQLSPCCQ
jgi:hypothetical protein